MIKKIMIIVIISALCIVIVTWFFRLNIGDIYFSNKYRNELNILKNQLKLISTGNEEVIKRITTSDSIILKEYYLENLPYLIKKIDLMSLRIRFVKEQHEGNDQILFIEIFFDKNPDMYMLVKYIKKSNVLLIDSIMISDSIIKKYCSEGKENSGLK